MACGLTPRAGLTVPNAATITPPLKNGEVSVLSSRSAHQNVPMTVLQACSLQGTNMPRGFDANISVRGKKKPRAQPHNRKTEIQPAAAAGI